MNDNAIEHDPFRGVREVLGRLHVELVAESVRALEQTRRLTALDAAAALDYAHSRATFTAALAALEVELGVHVAEAARSLGMATFDVTDLTRRFPEPGRKLGLALHTVQAAAAAVRRQDALNRLLAERARTCVTAWLIALSGPPAAYDRRGAARDLTGFATAVRVV